MTALYDDRRWWCSSADTLCSAIKEREREREWFAIGDDDELRQKWRERESFSFPPRRTDYVYRTRYGGRWLSFPSAVASPVTSVGRPVSSSHSIHCIRLRSVPSS
ncbi:hypothetical protein B296_00002795 [Ensete ventricosum]|uniref:Uncharacterized protein n=1 Tax=Ensete ventricosum TaxID=4639 RepID=A0A426YNK9_ENSVE|nr:hypothetical protein B296_00002795 [Ensete ventricosum]